MIPGFAISVAVPWSNALLPASLVSCGMKNCNHCHVLIPALIHNFVRKTICENPANISAPVPQSMNERINEQTIDRLNDGLYEVGSQTSFMFFVPASGLFDVCESVRPDFQTVIHFMNRS
jgi:hypothetical protein